MTLFNRLFSRKPRAVDAPPQAYPTPPAPPAPPPAPAAPSTAVSTPSALIPPPADGGWTMDHAGPDADEGDEEGGAADPAISSQPLLETARAERGAVVRMALSRPHKITPNDPAGPGSLAEVLMQLDALGEVSACVIEDEDVGFCILYEPALANADSPA